jgi:hypothetical protein
LAINTEQPTVIFPDGFNSRTEDEMPLKGYLADVVVRFDDAGRYRLSFIDPIRLGQDLADEVEAGHPYLADPGLVVLPEVTRESICKAVEGLWREGYFAFLRPVDCRASDTPWPHGGPS